MGIIALTHYEVSQIPSLQCPQKTSKETGAAQLRTSCLMFDCLLVERDEVLGR